MGDPHIFNTKHRFAKSSSHLLSANPWRHAVESGVQLHCSHEQRCMILAESDPVIR